MGLVWPDNVHEQVVARPTNGPDPIVAGDRSRSSELEEKTWSRARSKDLVTAPIRGSCVLRSCCRRIFAVPTS